MNDIQKVLGFIAAGICVIAIIIVILFSAPSFFNILYPQTSSVSNEMINSNQTAPSTNPYGVAFGWAIIIFGIVAVCGFALWNYQQSKNGEGRI